MEKRYKNAISALIDNEDFLNASDASQNSGNTKTPVNPDPNVHTLNPSSFRLGDIHEKVLLESFLDGSSIKVRAVKLFPINCTVRFPKKLREENPVGAQFLANVEVSSSTVEPDKLFLKAHSKTITLVSGGSVQKIDTQTQRPIRPIPQETPELGKSGSIRKPSNLLEKLPSVYSPEEKETFPVKGLEDAETDIEKFICALRGLVWEIRGSNKGKKTLNLTNGVRQPSLSGEYGYLYAFKFDSDEEFFEGARIDIQVGSRKIKGSIASIFGDQIRTLVIAMDEDCGELVDYCSITQDDATFFESLQNRLEIEDGIGDKKKGKPVGMNLALAGDLLKGKSSQLTISSTVKLDYSELNEDQIDFTKKMVKNSISFCGGHLGLEKHKHLEQDLHIFTIMKSVH